MTEVNQNLTVFQGEDIDITVTLTGVTLTGTETVEASFRDRMTQQVVLTVAGTIGAPATVTIPLTSAQTDALRGDRSTSKVTHDWALWRTDESAETPYLIGSVVVVDTART